MSKAYQHTATFTSVARVVCPTAHDRFIAKASLIPLKHLLPTDLDPDLDPDLLYFAANGAVASLCNLNNHCIGAEAALTVHASARNKYVSADHDRNKIVGVILYPGLSRYGSNEPLTQEEAATLKEPFNMSVAGALWKVINPQIAKYITRDAGGTGEDVLSLSWEIAYNDYDIGVGSRNVFDAEIIAAGTPRFEVYDKMLRDNGGEGKDPAGKDVFRIIKSDAILLGYSIVPNPAAAVKGILPITNEPVIGPEEEGVLAQLPESQRSIFAEMPDVKIGCFICDLTMENGSVLTGVPVFQGGYVPRSIDAAHVTSVALSEQNEKKNINSTDTRITVNTHPMKIEKLEQLTSEWPEIRKLESAASVVSFVEAIQNGSAEYIKQLQAKEDLLKTTQSAKEAAEARVKEIEASLNTVKQELDALRAVQASAEAEKKFQERMTAMDEEFELDVDDRKIIASDIKDLNDEGFAAYMTKCKKLMSDKSKAAKKAATVTPAAVVPSVDPKAAIASVTPVANQPAIPNGVTPNTTLADQMKAAFGGSVKVDGKTVTEITKKKSS